MIGRGSGETRPRTERTAPDRHPGRYRDAGGGAPGTRDPSRREPGRPEHRLRRASGPLLGSLPHADRRALGHPRQPPGARGGARGRRRRRRRLAPRRRRRLRPDPDGVVERLRDVGATGVRGNHDAAACGGSEIEWFNPEARRAMEWTRGAISPPSSSGCPRSRIAARRRHASWSTAATASRSGSTSPPSRSRGRTSRLLGRPDRAARPHPPPRRVRRGRRRRRRGPRPPGMTLELGGRRALVNPGSVGQPRDGDPDASYLVWDPDAERVTWHRVRYDVAAVQRAMREAGLPLSLAWRSGSSPVSVLSWGAWPRAEPPTSPSPPRGSPPGDRAHSGAFRRAILALSGGLRRPDRPPRGRARQGPTRSSWASTSSRSAGRCRSTRTSRPARTRPSRSSTAPSSRPRRARRRLEPVLLQAREVGAALVDEATERERRPARRRPALPQAIRGRFRDRAHHSLRAQARTVRGLGRPRADPAEAGQVSVAAGGRKEAG